MPKRPKRIQASGFTDVKRFASTQEIDRHIEMLNRRVKDVQALQADQVAFNSQRAVNVESSIRNSVLEIFDSRSPEFGEYGGYKLFSPDLAFTTSRAMTEHMNRENQRRFLVELPETVTMLEGLISRLEEKRSDLERVPVQVNNASEQFSAAPDNPHCAFLSYSHDSEEHGAWVRDLAVRLRADGVETILDRWELIAGDQIPEFMERAVRENDFVLIVCTPRYKERSDARVGGVGYEGDIMTAEVYKNQNHRKFIPILRNGGDSAAVPSWLSGKLLVDLRGDPYSEEQYDGLLDAIHGTSEKPPPIGPSRFSKHPLDRAKDNLEPEHSKPGRHSERSRAAGRDVLAEAISNVRRVLSVEATTLQYEITDLAWRLQRPEIAFLFQDDWDGLQRVVGAYDSAYQVSTHSHQWNPFGMSPTHNREAKDLLLRHAGEWLDAIDILKAKVLRPDEAAKTTGDIDGLKSRLQCAKELIELDRRRS